MFTSEIIFIAGISNCRQNEKNNLQLRSHAYIYTSERFIYLIWKNEGYSGILLRFYIITTFTIRREKSIGVWDVEIFSSHCTVFSRRLLRTSFSVCTWATKLKYYEKIESHSMKFPRNYYYSDFMLLTKSCFFVPVECTCLFSLNEETLFIYTNKLSRLNI